MSPKGETSPGTTDVTWHWDTRTWHEEQEKLSWLLRYLKEKTCVSEGQAGKGRVWTCCPLGWEPFQASCYYFSKDIMNWDDSERNCTGMGSHLVVINTVTEQDFISNYVKRTVIGIQVENYYIGLAQQKKGQWRWVDLTPYNKTAVFWIPGEPNNLIVEKCVAVDTSKKENMNWNNFPCIVPSHRICETVATNI
ncbi:C-type lectin domain family 4 member D-like isoform X3 [Dermochelys coriacea]|uniref:C-type lectin domain family 4 member D-like isoform X3 n=1 Tax=Dermochelys coriacea TaxID=27794 RepID=UPI001CA94B1B|nr:C-type lectin domain family 4 member D-like isoform X3 [Dermochelys coriacea]